MLGSFLVPAILRSIRSRLKSVPVNGCLNVHSLKLFFFILCSKSILCLYTSGFPFDSYCFDLLSIGRFCPWSRLEIRLTEPKLSNVLGTFFPCIVFTFTILFNMLTCSFVVSFTFVLLVIEFFFSDTRSIDARDCREVALFFRYSYFFLFFSLF